MLFDYFDKGAPIRFDTPVCLSFQIIVFSSSSQHRHMGSTTTVVNSIAGWVGRTKLFDKKNARLVKQLN